MSVRSNPTPVASASLPPHIAAAQKSHLSALDTKIDVLGSVKIKAASGLSSMMGTAHEDAGQVVTRLIKDNEQHVGALFEKCFIEKSTPDEAMAEFTRQMKRFLGTSWAHSFKSEDARNAKVAEVVTELIKKSGSFAEVASRRAAGFKEALASASRCDQTAADGHYNEFKSRFQELCARVVEGRDVEASGVIKKLVEVYGKAFVAEGKFFDRLYNSLCKGELRKASPLEIQLMLVKELSSRFLSQPGYTPAKAMEKAYAVAKEICKDSQAEVQKSSDNIDGYLQVAGGKSAEVNKTRSLSLEGDLKALVEAPVATEAHQKARIYEAFGELKANAALNATLTTVLSSVGEAPSTTIVAKFTPEIMAEVIRTCLANTDPSANSSKESVIAAIKAGFTAHFITDTDSILRTLIKPERKSIQEKLEKIQGLLIEKIRAGFSEGELEAFCKERTFFEQGVSGSRGSSEGLSRFALSRASTNSRAYENSWRGFEEKVRANLVQKGGGSYQSSSIVMDTIFGSSAGLCKELVSSFYKTAGSVTPEEFRFDFITRMQSLLAQIDESYYFVKNPDKALTKSEDLYKFFMAKLGVAVTGDKMSVAPGQGSAKPLSEFEKLRRAELPENTLWAVDRDQARLYSQYLAARDHDASAVKPGVSSRSARSETPDSVSSGSVGPSPRRVSLEEGLPSAFPVPKPSSSSSVPRPVAAAPAAASVSAHVVTARPSTLTAAAPSPQVALPPQASVRPARSSSTASASSVKLPPASAVAPPSSAPAPSKAPLTAGSSSTVAAAGNVVAGDVLVKKEKWSQMGLPSAAIVTKLKDEFGAAADSVIAADPVLREFARVSGSAAGRGGLFAGGVPTLRKTDPSESEEVLAHEAAIASAKTAPSAGSAVPPPLRSGFTAADLGGVKLKRKDQQRPIASEPVKPIKPKIVPRSGQTQEEAEAEAKSRAETGNVLRAGLVRVRGAVAGTNRPAQPPAAQGQSAIQNLLARYKAPDSDSDSDSDSGSGSDSGRK